MWLLLFDIFPPRKTVYFYNGLSQQSQQIQRTLSCKTYRENSDGRPCSDTQTTPHPSWTRHQAPVFPDKLQVDPCSAEHTPAEMKERDPVIPAAAAAAVWSCCRCALSPPVPAAPSGSVSQCQKTRLLKAIVCVHNWQPAPKSPLQSSPRFSEDIPCTSVTEAQRTSQRCVRDRTGCERGPVLRVLHMMVLHQSLQVD